MESMKRERETYDRVTKSNRCLPGVPQRKEKRRKEHRDKKEIKMIEKF